MHNKNMVYSASVILLALMVIAPASANAPAVGPSTATIKSVILNDPDKVCERAQTLTVAGKMGPVVDAVQEMLGECHREFCIEAGGEAECVGPGDGGVTVSRCVRGAFVCAMAGADTHEEKLNNAPNMGFAMTMGHCQSNWEFGGTCKVETDLGGDEFDFPKWGGEGRSYTDMSTGGCKWESLKAKTTATSAPWIISATAIDLDCEAR